MKEDQRELVTYLMERWRKMTSISVITGKSQQISLLTMDHFILFFFLAPIIFITPKSTSVR